MNAASDPIDTAAYSAWKGWDEEGRFGVLERGDIAYFDRELRNVSGAIVDVLEIGFGSGRFLAYCRHKGWNVSGTELAPEQLDAARAGGFDAHPAEALAALAERSVDLVAAFDVLEHIPESEAVRFMTLLGSKTRVGGSVLLRYPNADSWLGNVFQHGDPTHVGSIGFYKLQYLAAQAGLEIVAYRAPTRRGFRTSLIHGLHVITAGVVVKAIAALQKALYFPGLTLVLSSSNVVCVLTPRSNRSQGLPSAR